MPIYKGDLLLSGLIRPQIRTGSNNTAGWESITRVYVGNTQIYPEGAPQEPDPDPDPNPVTGLTLVNIGLFSAPITFFNNRFNTFYRRVFGADVLNPGAWGFGPSVDLVGGNVRRIEPWNNVLIAYNNNSYIMSTDGLNYTPVNVQSSDRTIGAFMYRNNVSPQWILFNRTNSSVQSSTAEIPSINTFTNLIEAGSFLNFFLEIARFFPDVFRNVIASSVARANGSILYNINLSAIFFVANYVNSNVTGIVTEDIADMEFHTNSVIGVAVGSQGILRTVDRGENWQRLIGPNIPYQGVCAGFIGTEPVFFCVGNSRAAIVRANGTLQILSNVPAGDWEKCSFGAGRFVATRVATSNAVMVYTP